eukprot:6772263-Alexandrium_andersonii.AAC.1
MRESEGENPGVERSRCESEVVNPGVQHYLKGEDYAYNTAKQLSLKAKDCERKLQLRSSPTSRTAWTLASGTTCGKTPTMATSRRT